MRSKLRLICLSPQFLIFSLWTFLLFSFQVHADDSSKYMQAGYDYGDAPASYASKPKHQVLAFKHTNGTTALDHYTTTNGSQTDQGAYTMHQTDSGSIFIGGRFSKFNGTAVNSPKLAKLNSSTFQEQGTFLTSAPNNDVTALASYRLPNSTTEYLIVGGRFTNIGGQARNRLAIINLATNQVLAWDANLASTVHSIAVDKERAILHVGGDFGYYQYSLANLASNPSTITPSQSHTTGRVFSIYLDRNSQQVFIGGTFSNFLNSGKQYFAVLDANTQSVLPNAPSANGVVYSISSRLGNRAYLIGDFTTLGNYNRAGLAAIDLPSLTVNDVWNPGHTWSNKSSDPGQSTADGDGDGLGGTRYGLVAAHILYADNFDVIVARSGMQSYAGSTISMVAQHMELGSIDPETGEYGGWLPHIPTNYTPTITAYHHLLSANGYLYVSASNDLLVRYVMIDPAPKVYLGDSIDMEATHTTSTDASGDASDDDGIIGSIPNLKIGDTSYSVVVKVTNNQNKTAYIRGWVDLNKNSVFDSTEANNANLTIPANTTALFTLTWNSASFFPITTGKEGQTFLRLRVSSVDPTVNEESTNNLIDGEVEDYPVSITPVISPIIYTPPTSAGKCQAKSVEQLDKFQYATATGSGASGMANLTYTPPDGTSRMMMVFISVERDHSPFNVRGDNFEINIPSSQTITNADIPTVTVNGQSMNKMSFAVEMYGTGNNYADAEISRSYYFYTLFDPAIPKTATPITITGLNLPKSAGDEMMVGAVTFGNVLAAQPIDSQIDRTNPFQIDLNVSPVIANLADQAFGTTTADNAVIAFGNGSKTENLTIGTGWTKLAEIPIANNAGGYKNDTNRSYSVNTEDDGHTFYLQAIKNVTTPQTASISSTSNLSSLGLQAFRLVPILCEHGDAPESYGNAYHGASGIRYLGSIKGDQEPSNAQNVDANGDDTSNSADEDGVTIPTLIPNQANNFTVKVNGTNLATPAGKAYLNAWIDLDGNGKFESTEQIAKDVQDTDGDGQTIVPVTVNDNTPSRTYARFRISASPGALSTGYADYGEVEDYVVNVAKTEIKGRAWHDKNGNGLQDDGNMAYIAGAKVELFDPAINDLIAITTTDAQGNYSFIEQNYSKPVSLPVQNVTKATPIAASKAYQIRITKMWGIEPFSDWQLTDANKGTDDTLDSDALSASNYWVINVTSPLAGQISNHNDFGFKNTIIEGCLDIGSTGISDDTLVNAHSNSYDFNFSGKQLTGFCLERNDASPQLNDSYEINATDRQGLSTASRAKLARLFNALTDPEISFSIASVSNGGREQLRLDDLLGAMVWYYTFYYENISNIDSLLDNNTNLTTDERKVLKNLARKIANRVDGSNGEYQYTEQAVYWLWNKTTTDRQDIIVPAIYAKGASCSGARTLSGTVFEDVNYAGGAGRSATTAGAKGVTGAKVELYNATGAYVSNTTTASDGTYSFSGLSAANYYVRVVNDTIKSTRTGGNGTERGVQTYRSAGTTEVTNQVGGENPSVVDAAANTSNLALNTTSFTFPSGTQAQSVQFVALNSNINNVNFGFNFDTIVNTNDAGQGSLRQFLLNSNLLKNNEIAQNGLSTGVETSIFMIPGTGPFSIKPSSALPTISDSNTAVDGATQPNASCADANRALMIMLDGTNAGNAIAGLKVDVARTSIRGLAIGNFTDAGLSATANANNLVVTCNNLGLAADGSTAAKNGTNGLTVVGAQDLTVGGTDTDTRNVISNNHQNGIYLEKVTRATISNNRIGTSADGLSARSNNQVGAEYAGIRVKGTSNTVRASDITIHSNQLAGNNKTLSTTSTTGGSHAIYVDTTNTLTVTGNLIGLTPDGLGALNNIGNGVYTSNTTTVTIGGITADKRNIIAGNADAIKTGFGTQNLTILGNYIGTDITGLKAIANESNGIFLSDTANAKIGDGTAAGRNIIANNKLNGIRNSKTPNTEIKGNYIGTDKNGASAFGNSEHGIYVQNSAGVVIGGSNSADGNVIANGKRIGILAVDAASNVLIENNIIGLAADGTTIAANTQSGIETKDTNGITIRNNTLSGNGASGIHLVSSPSSSIINNRIGTDTSGNLDKGNKGTGIDVQTASTNLTINGNVISGNDSHGIQFTDGDASGTLVYDNRIGTTQNGSTALANNGAGILVNKTPNLTIGSTSSAGNTISGNGQSGINLFNDQTNLLSKNITIVGNNIGISKDATTAIANTAHGVLIQHVSDVKIGDGTVSGSNRIAYNNQAGLQITGTTNNVTVNRNAIYANNQLGIDLNMDVISLNDANDVDTGPNAILNAPIISSMILNGANMTLTGCAPAGSVVEVYEADVSTGSAATAGANRFSKSKDYGEGQSFLTSFTEGSSADTDSGNCALPVDADGNNQTGMQAFTVTTTKPATIADKDLITATATVNGVGTSEFGTVTSVGPITCSLVVKTTSDIDSTANNAGSLRDAIECANAQTGADTITFNMPTTEPGYDATKGIWKLQLSSALPAITDSKTTIDASTQTGAACGNLLAASHGRSLKVQLDGTGLSSTKAGLTIQASDFTLKGLSITNFANNAVDTTSTANNAKFLCNHIGVAPDGLTAGNNGIGLNLFGNNSLVGGVNDGDSNIIAGNTSNAGIVFNGIATKAGLVQGNYIGIGLDGSTAVGNGIGIANLESSELTIGGATAATRNIISGNTSGISITGPKLDSNVIKGNYIGTDKTGLVAVGNAVGITLDAYATNVSIGSTAIGEGNVISGNSIAGISTGADHTLSSSFNTITGNIIGLGADKTTAVPNADGIILYKSDSISISKNTIARNSKNGIHLAEKVGNSTISQNSIYANAELGIDLRNSDGTNVTQAGITLNDANDADTGANQLLNFPVISGLTYSGSNITVTGCAPAGATVELFEADVSPGGTASAGSNRFGKVADYGEGQTYLTSFNEGSAADTSTASCSYVDIDTNSPTGMQAFSITLAKPASLNTGDAITATATLANKGTSEFSPAFGMQTFDSCDATLNSHFVLSGKMVPDPNKLSQKVDYPAKFDATTSELILTPDQFFISGAAWSDAQISLLNPFSLRFRVWLGSNNTVGPVTFHDLVTGLWNIPGTGDTGADGIAFAFHNDPRGANVSGINGAALGVGGISPAIGIEFDTFENNYGNFNDIPEDHTVIYDPTSYNDVSGGGAASLISPVINLGELEDSKWHNVELNWNPSTKQLTYIVDSTVLSSITRDLINTDFKGNPYVYYGFAGGTGASKNLQKVCITNSPPFVSLKAIRGKVFEDINYGGGAGRALTGNNSAKGLKDARVELYNASGTLVANTLTTADGSYSFNPTSNGDYYVRIVNDTLKSTRTGSNGTERAVQTYRTDGTTAVTNEVGGRKPSATDAGANSSNLTLNTTNFTFSNNSQVQSVQLVKYNNADINGVDFGFNFDTIVNTNDSGQGSLRQFIINSNLLKDNASLAQVGLRAGQENSILMLPTTDPNYNATGNYWSIKPSSILPKITDTLVLDARTQPGYSSKPIVELNGTNAGKDNAGLILSAGSNGSIIQGLIINNFNFSGIYVESINGLTVLSNYIGTTPDGTTAASNHFHGIHIDGASNVKVGDASIAGRNVISGNIDHGISTANNASNITILGNYIGINAAGNNKLPNWGSGVNVDYVTNMQIGDGTANGRNVIASNLRSAIYVEPITGAVDTVKIDMNYLGTNAAGTASLSNGGTLPQVTTISRTGDGVSVSGLVKNIEIRHNLLSGNTEGESPNGIEFWNATVNAPVIADNIFGLNAAGMAALPNAWHGLSFKSNNTTASVTNAQISNNLFAGNNKNGLYANAILKSATLTNNRFGLSASGLDAIPNGEYGILLEGASNVRIGNGTSAGANTIANNAKHGLAISSGINNTINQNSFYSNGRLGIDLGNDTVSLNDANDADTGANQLLNFPIISKSTISGSNVTLEGCAPANATVEVYLSDTTKGGVATVGANRMGKLRDYGEGHIFLTSFVEGSASDSKAGTCTLSKDGDGNDFTGLNAFSVTLSKPSSLMTDSTLTATATLTNVGTSEFSPTYTMQVFEACDTTLNQHFVLNGIQRNSVTGADEFAPPTISGAGEITLTQLNKYSAGSAWSNKQIDLRQPFSLRFRVWLGDRTGTQPVNIFDPISNSWVPGSMDAGADGIAFAFHNDPRGGAVNGIYGGALGVGGLKPAIAAEFDTFDNLANNEFEFGDIPNDHTMIYNPENYMLTMGGGAASRYSNIIDLGNIEDGEWHNVEFTWNPATTTFTYLFDGVAHLSMTKDIIKDLFNNNSYVYYGFSAGTGEAYNLQKVCVTHSPPFISNSSVTGTIFEDTNYGGGDGRAFGTAGTVGVNNATIELYDKDGKLVAITQSYKDGTKDGTYKLPPIPAGDYYVRVVSSSVKSTRAGATTDLVPVLTYRTDGITAVTNQVGGNKPHLIDALANTSGEILNPTTFLFNTGSLNGKPAQVLQPIKIAENQTLNNVSFGFNFNTVVNTNDKDAGSLRQVLINTQTLGGEASLAQASAADGTARPAGKDNIVFMLPTTDPNYKATDKYWQIVLNTSLPKLSDNIVLDASLQTGYSTNTRPVVELNGSGIVGVQANGLTLEGKTTGSVIKGLAINSFTGNGILINQSQNNIVQKNIIGSDPTNTKTSVGNGGSGISVTDQIGTNLVGGSNTNEGNTIVNNAGDGVTVTGSGGTNRVSILGNNIANNTGLGIDLGNEIANGGVTANDLNDSDTGANDLLNYPVSTEKAFATNGTRIVAYNVDIDVPAGDYRMEVFSSTSKDASGYGEGQTYVGYKNISHTGAGKVRFQGTINANQTVASNAIITATLTQIVGTGFGATSEFSGNNSSISAQVCEEVVADLNQAITNYTIDESFVPVVVMLGTNPTTKKPMMYIINRLPQGRPFVVYASPDTATLSCTDIVFQGEVVTKALALDGYTSFIENSTKPVIVLRNSDDNIELTFSIAGGTDAAAFSVDAATGSLQFKQAPDFEAPHDSNKDNVYAVEVEAKQGTEVIRSHKLNISISDSPDDNSISLSSKAFLQGAYDSRLGLMNNALLMANLLPDTQPYAAAPFHYAGKESLSANVKTLTGGDAPVDWVLLELRSANDSSKVLASKAVILQRDGDMIDANTGATQLAFKGIGSGDYYISLRHRNHLGIMTAKPISLNASNKLVDFSLMPTTVKGEHTRYVYNNVAMLWAGDINGSNTIESSGADNDVNYILASILTDPANADASSNYILRGYQATDLNLDGITLFTGPNNDLNLLSGNIMMHPANSEFAANYIIRGSLP